MEDYDMPELEPVYVPPAGAATFLQVYDAYNPHINFDLLVDFTINEDAINRALSSVDKILECKL